MKTNKFAIFAVVLWVVSALVFGWFFVKGNTTAIEGQRDAIVLHPAERELVLLEMRGLLISTQGILDGLNKQDMKQVAKAATASGMGSAADVNPALMAKLPMSFKDLGMSVHHSMDEIAADAQAGKPAEVILNKLSNTLTSCVACHAAWQLKSE
jgi:cytochrome c553